MDNKLPPPIQVSQGSSGSDSSKDDASLVEFKVKNPFFKFFEWLKNFIKKNQNITIKIPIIGVFVALSSFSIGLGSGYNWGLNAAVSKFFPNSSPILHRAISIEGIIQKSATSQYYLKSEDNLWTLKPKPPITLTTLNNSVSQKVKVLGNLTKQANLIEVSEVILQESAQTSLTSLTSPNIPDPSKPPSRTELPPLYSGLSWETNQRKTLIFTSGKRKIEQEGIYLESAQLTVFPQDFINYYIQALKDAGFKETLNSISPEGVTITYAKDGLFLTFGIKNIYSGSGDKKQLAGYKAYIEHN